MREIKFRQPIFNKGKFVKWHYWGRLSDGCFVSPINLAECNGIDGYQFTGLTDKNGSEIYERDVVNVPERLCRGDGHYDDDLAVVVWHEYSWMLKFISDNDSYDGLCFHEEATVISNIPENPELLEDR